VFFISINEKHQSSEQIAVIGFVIIGSEIITPKLSTVEQPSYEMGVEV
jgi:DNA-binding LacI/PurR family transcriptional regulator